MFDLVITGGTLLDGTGAPRRRADIGITGDKIAAVGNLEEAQSKRSIDAGGKMVSPGFIDMHTHSDFSYVYDPKAGSKIHSGVTTEVIGNCGIGPAPLVPENKQLLIDYLGTRLVGSIPVTLELPWSTFAEYLDTFKSKVPAVNVAPLVGQGVVRIAVKGFAKGEPTAGEIAAMQKFTEEAMAQGALGLSTGLVYMPGEYSSAGEVAELCKVMKPYHGFYTTHMRTESDGIMEAIDEALEIGAKGGCPVHISHMKLLSQSMLGKTDLVLARFEKAEKEGVQVTYDLYPYTAGLTSLGACLPPWVFEGGVDKMLERLRDNSVRQRIRKEIAEGLPGWQNFVKSAGGWQKFFVSSVRSEENKHLEGKFIPEIGEMQGKDAYDAAFDLLIAENGRVQMNYYAMSEDDVITFMQQPRAMVGSDAMALSTEGVLAFGNPHPRAFGTPTRVLGRYVRELKALTFEQAVQKMTSMPAKRLGLAERGLIKEGWHADITVFDPEKVQDKATYTEPKQYSVGVDYVIVNGSVALENGVIQTPAGRVVGR